MNPFRRLIEMPGFMRDHRWTRAHMSEQIDGDLAPEDEARARHHLEGCASCRRLLEVLRRTVAGLGLLREPSPPGFTDRVVSRMERDAWPAGDHRERGDAGAPGDSDPGSGRDRGS